MRRWWAPWRRSASSSTIKDGRTGGLEAATAELDWTALAASHEGHAEPNDDRSTFGGVEDVFTLVLLVVIVVITIGEVIGRYRPSLAIPFSDQILPDLLVWLVLLGTASAVRRNEHLGMSALADNLGPRARVRLSFVIRAIEALFFVVLLWQGVEVVRDQISLQQASAAGYPAWFIALALPVGAGIALLNIAVRAISHVRSSRSVS